MTGRLGPERLSAFLSFEGFTAGAGVVEATGLVSGATRKAAFRTLIRFFRSRPLPEPRIRNPLR